MEITRSEQQKEKNFLNDSLRYLWHNIKPTNIHIIGVPGGEKKRAESFPNLEKKTDIQAQEAESPKQDEPKEIHPNTHCNENGKN